MRATIVMVADVDDLEEFEAALAPAFDEAAARIARELGVDVEAVGFESITVDELDVDEIELEDEDDGADDGD
jgi:hypothetical protein